MKVLCSACEAAEARMLCCADEAALCARCDRDVHAANRLAGKHHRLPLLPPADVSAPSCDICQEAHAYFFCVEDRALLCRACDVAVHTANAFVSTHRRFLLTGVQVGLQPDAADAAQDPDPHPPTAATAAEAAHLQTPPPPDRKAAAGGGSPAPLYSDDEIDWAAGTDAGAGVGVGLPDWALVHEQFGAPPVPSPAEPAIARTPASKRSPRRSLAAAFTVQGGGGLAGGLPDWPLDEFFGFSEYSAGLGFAENGTSKADSGKLGSTVGSPAGRSSSDASQDFFGEVPEFHQWSVPELPSPPTASGLHWQGAPRHGATTTTDTDTAAVFVPDISSPENPFRCYATAAGQPPAKRRRRC
ncbi:B-box zinc finger protein 22-like [Miscanthus floridulus]|uniref:B-box zinc finger protein 22-like n=1 Tax=Miscanthus floridulus TaxID=154761 RepID=UPI00345B2E35